MDFSQRIKNSSSLWFADDVKLFREVRSLNDAIGLQEDLNAFFEWCVENKMLGSVMNHIFKAKKSNQLCVLYG